jgi:hypothetical protein
MDFDEVSFDKMIRKPIYVSGNRLRGKPGNSVEEDFRSFGKRFQEFNFSSRCCFASKLFR